MFYVHFVYVSDFYAKFYANSTEFYVHAEWIISCSDIQNQICRFLLKIGNN